MHCSQLIVPTRLQQRTDTAGSNGSPATMICHLPVTGCSDTHARNGTASGDLHFFEADADDERIVMSNDKLVAKSPVREFAIRALTRRPDRRNVKPVSPEMLRVPVHPPHAANS